jgi:hypothetical protein
VHGRPVRDQSTQYRGLIGCINPLAKHPCIDVPPFGDRFAGVGFGHERAPGTNSSRSAPIWLS